MGPSTRCGGDGNASLTVKIDHASIVIPEYIPKNGYKLSCDRIKGHKSHNFSAKSREFFDFFFTILLLKRTGKTSDSNCDKLFQ